MILATPEDSQSRGDSALSTSSPVDTALPTDCTLPSPRLSTPTNHLSEPPWVATIKLAGSLVAGLEHYDLQATHSN